MELFSRGVIGQRTHECIVEGWRGDVHADDFSLRYIYCDWSHAFPILFFPQVFHIFINTKKMSDITFKGWAGLDEHACEGKMSFQEFEPKVFDDDDVDVKILYCGICGSDTSQLSGHWGPVEKVVPQVYSPHPH